MIWEDEEPGSARWWLARAHDASEKRRDFFIVEDDLAGFLVGVMRLAPSSRYRVVAAVLSEEHEDKSHALLAAKSAVTSWLASPKASGARRNVWRWRRARWSKLIWKHLPIAFAGFAVGAVLGLLVGVFAVTSGLVGWPMLVAGLIIGAGAGPALRYLVDRHPRHAPAGPWTRLAVITAAALIGAALSAGGVFALFWEA
ncbi:MAG: hypothetical protein RLN70_12555 [Rhodospirillaceae bacterium]